MTQISHLAPISLRLRDGLRRIQVSNLEFPLIPLNNNKQPLGDGWQHRPFSAAQLIEAIENGGVKVPIKGNTRQIQPQGFGLLTGRPLILNNETYYLMAVDRDGSSAIDKIQELSRGKPLPKTVAFTSDRPGRCQFLFLVPEAYKDAIRTKKLKTGVNGEDNKPEQLELRWTNLQSVLPPSVHPLTGKYRWVDGCAIDETEIAIAPDWIIEQMLIEQGSFASLGSRGAGGQGGFKDKEEVHSVPASSYHSSNPKTTSSKFSTSRQRWNDIDFALSYLDAISSYRADDYDEWLTVGMALHSIDEELLDSWDKWSAQSAKYKSGDCERKWRSFSPGGGVTLGSLAHMAKQDGWQSPFNNKNIDWSDFGKGSALRGLQLSDRYKNSKSKTRNATVTGDTQQNGDTSKVELLSEDATVTTVSDVLKAGLTDYAERARLDVIEARSVISKAAFWQMVAAIRTSLDEIQPEDTEQFNRLIDWHNATLDFERVLPQHLADAFKRDAAILNIDPVSLWQYFLPTVLSLAGKRVSLDVESHSLPAIAWTCIVGESGTGKSRAESVILANLKQKQHKEKKRWLEQMQEYKQICQSKSKNDDIEIQSPIPERKYLFEVATIQAVMRRLSEQRENGSIWARDEIAGLFKSLGQFQGKKGDNEGLECLLKMWDGSGSFVDRVNAENDSYAVPETRLSIAGGIQPGAFRTAFKDPDDAQGLQARFLYAIPQVFPAKRVKGYCQLSDILPPLYDWLDRLPISRIKLSPDADRRYSNLVEQIGLQAEQSSSGAVRAWMRKLPTQLLRIALALHLVECYGDRNRSFDELQLATLERAVEVCRYYRSAFAVVREKTADSDNISSILLKMWDMATIKPDGVTPRELYRGIKAIARRAKQIGRGVGAYTIELINKLVQMGKGTLEKNGRSIRFFAKLNAQNNLTSTLYTTQEKVDLSPIEDKPTSKTELEEVQLERSPSNLPLVTPTSELAPGSALRGQPEGLALRDRDSNSNYSESVTEETEAQNFQSQQLQPSSTRDVSPVTAESEPANADKRSESEKEQDFSQKEPIVPSTKQMISANTLEPKKIEKSLFEEDKSSLEHQQNINWLLQFLADLESNPTPHRRFTSLEQLKNLFDELEQRIANCYDEIRSKCPDYLERIMNAQKIVSEYFPLSDI